MILTSIQTLITIGVISLGTLITRFLPFIIFPAHKQTPKYIQYLGKTLPFATIGLLVVYCLKKVTIIQYPFALPEIISILIIAILHIWKKNILLSIGGGTIIYMLLVQYLFV